MSLRAVLVLNILVSSREGVIHRITPRRNDSVNDSWMADSGRDLYNQVNPITRLFLLRRLKSEFIKCNQFGNRSFIQAKNVGIVGSCHSSVEEQYLLTKLAKQLKRRSFYEGILAMMMVFSFPPTVHRIFGVIWSLDFPSKYPTDDYLNFQRHSIRNKLMPYCSVGEESIESGLIPGSIKGIPSYLIRYPSKYNFRTGQGCYYQA